MTRAEVIDRYFMDARYKLIDIAAFLDRVERAEGREDFRVEALRKALGEVTSKRKDKARRVLLSFSDPTSRPILKAPGKGACGAWPGKAK